MRGLIMQYKKQHFIVIHTYISHALLSKNFKKEKI